MFQLSKCEATNMWDDIVKYLTIAVTFHILSYCVDDQGEFLDERAIKFIIYIAIGVIMYYVVVNKLVTSYRNTRSPSKLIHTGAKVETPNQTDENSIPKSQIEAFSDPVIGHKPMFVLKDRFKSPKKKVRFNV